MAFELGRRNCSFARSIGEERRGVVVWWRRDRSAGVGMQVGIIMSHWVDPKN
jgi:hypothetical protein